MKNSWGGSWGEEGYILLDRDSSPDGAAGECGLMQQPSYPVVKGGPSPPGPTPPSPPAGKTHYGDPKDGCMSDETEITIQGVQGDFCTPKCSLFKACPTDVPAGVTVAPQCALQDSSTGDKYCALICSPTLPILDQKAADAQCGGNASCKSVQLGVGVCTYDD